MRSLEIDPIHHAFGIEVGGVDIRNDLDTDTAAEIRRLFDVHHLLLFRDQHLDGDDQIRFCRYLRPVVDPVAWISNVEEGFHPEGELLYHCDYAFTPHPMLGLSLYAVDLGEDAAPTRWASNVRALQTLPSTLRTRLKGHRVVHLIDTVNGRDSIRTRMSDIGGEDAPTDLYPRFARPAIWRHPVTGIELLFVLQQQASHFEGRTCEESDEVLDALFAHIYDPSNVLEHDWRVGDFVVWDNIALQHGRRANPKSVKRSLRRVAMNTVTTADLIAGTGFDPIRRGAPRG